MVEIWDQFVSSIAQVKEGIQILVRTWLTYGSLLKLRLLCKFVHPYQAQLSGESMVKCSPDEKNGAVWSGDFPSCKRNYSKTFKF